MKETACLEKSRQAVYTSTVYGKDIVIMEQVKAAPAKMKTQNRTIRLIKRYKMLYLLILPAFIWTIIFRYAPAWGALMAFYDYKPALGFSGSEFVGLKHFIRFVNDSNFWPLIRNTVVISGLRLILLCVLPVTFAILLNELSALKFKKFIQSVSYLPHFISYVVVANIAQTVLGTGGVVNSLLMSLGLVETPIVFFGLPKAYWAIISTINVWKGLGWSSIIYLSSITGIDPALYEAATVDGAGRFQRIWNITVPSIMPTMVVLLIMDVPDLLRAGFDLSYLLGNSLISDYSEVLDTYIYRIGIAGGQFSYSTAIGLFTQIISLILILAANTTARHVSEYSMF